MKLHKDIPASDLRARPDIIAKVGAEFDHLARLVAPGTGGFRGFQTDDPNALTAIIREKKTNSWAACPRGSWFE